MDNKEILKISLHPNKSLEYPYEEYEIRADRYLPLQKGEAKLSENGVEIIADLANVTIESPYDNVLRMRFAGKGAANKTVAQQLEMLLTNDECEKMNCQLDGDLVKAENKSMKLEYSLDTNEFKVSDKNGKTFLQTKKGGVRFTLDSPEFSGDKTLGFFELDADEEIFGFGGRIIHPRRKGTSVDVFDEKAGRLVGDYGGFPMPFFLSTKGYGVFLANPWPHVYFDMGKTNSDEWYFHTPGGDCDLYIIQGEEFNDIVSAYTRLTGRNMFPDKWHVGFWCSSVQMPTAEFAKENLFRMHSQGYPVDAVVIDGCWRCGPMFADAYTRSHSYMGNDFEWHKDFGDGSMFADLMQENIKTVLHINAFCFKKSTIEEGVKKGLLREIVEGTVADFSTKEGRDYYEKLLTPVIKDGLVQWWTDHADRISGEIKPGLPSRNTFGFIWNKFLNELMEKHGIKNHMALSRGGGIGSQRYAIPWPGDTAFGLDRYEEDIWYMLNAGLCGFGMQSVDLGGFFCAEFKADRTQEEALKEEFEVENIARRMCQSILFVPVPRVHNGDIGIPKFPWNCPEETRDLYKDCLIERYKLTPYIYSYAINSHLSGEPILRPLVYHHINDNNVYSIGDEFYMGENILVAPVTQKGASGREVYLPEGEWVNYWTGEQYKGNQKVYVDAPMLEVNGLPMFVKKGGVVVKQDECLTLTNELPERLYINFYTDDKAEITLYESQTVTNRFGIDGTKVYLENNSDKNREYVVMVNGKQNIFTAEAGKTVVADL